MDTLTFDSPIAPVISKFGPEISIYRTTYLKYFRNFYNFFQEYWLFNAYDEIVDELCTGILSENKDGDLMHDDDYENLLSIDKFLSTTA